MPQQVKISQRLYSLGALRGFSMFWINGSGYIFEGYSRDKIEAKCIAWRRDFHEHPELGNYEFKTAGIVAVFLI